MFVFVLYRMLLLGEVVGSPHAAQNNDLGVPIFPTYIHKLQYLITNNMQLLIATVLMTALYLAQHHAYLIYKATKLLDNVGKLNCADQ